MRTVKIGSVINDGILGDGYADWNYDETGKLIYVYGRNKVRQEIEKIVLTLKSIDNPYPNYGSVIYGYIGKKNIAGFVSSFLALSVRDALLYQRQLTRTAVNNTDEEVIRDIVAVDIKSDTREYVISASVRLLADRNVDVGLALKI